MLQSFLENDPTSLTPSTGKMWALVLYYRAFNLDLVVGFLTWWRTSTKGKQYMELIFILF
jgi:hypothetical protein